LIACRELTDLPIIANMTFAEDGRTVCGTDPLTALTVCQALGADVVGANCSTGPSDLIEVMRIMASATDLPLSVEPNAGMPELVEEKVVYRLTPDQMGEYAVKFAQLGVNIIGSCCGSTPEHTRRIREKMKRLKPIKREPRSVFRLSSRTRTVEIDHSLPLRTMGERINPSGRPRLTAALKSQQYSLVREEAVRQMNAGADILDLNVGAEGVDEKNALTEVVKVVQQAVPLPLSLDTTDAEALERALKEVEGKCLINSVTGEDEKLQRILPLAKRYGAAIVGLTIDENGIPEKAEDRLRIANKIIERAAMYGISRDDVLIDCLTLSAATNPESSLETLRALRLLKDKLKVRTILGISNISYGLPARSVLNASFLTMALTAGLDLPIINPYDPSIKQALDATNLLVGRDRGGAHFIQTYGVKLEEAPPSEPPIPEKKPIGEEIYQAVLTGNRESIEGFVEEALQSGIAPLKIANQHLIPALQEVGELFDAKRYFLPQVLLSAETMRLAFQKIKAALSKKEALPRKGTIVFATVKGDIHDIGKNIVSTLLESSGYRVIDLGKDVEREKIIAAARESRADIIALSALMTTTMLEMPRVIETARQSQCHSLIIVGGAVITSDYAEKIRADGYAKDAIKAVKLVDKLIKKRTKPNSA
ncbi:MAG: dihydropteroate synthase, partial [Acidobacteriota bacterium]